LLPIRSSYYFPISICHIFDGDALGKSHCEVSASHATLSLSYPVVSIGLMSDNVALTTEAVDSLLDPVEVQWGQAKSICDVDAIARAGDDLTDAQAHLLDRSS
jgi:hypothetical protein